MCFGRLPWNGHAMETREAFFCRFLCNMTVTYLNKTFEYFLKGEKTGIKKGMKLRTSPLPHEPLYGYRRIDPELHYPSAPVLNIST